MPTTDDSAPPPARAGDRDERKKRQAAALRDNLLKRKAQTRARRDTGETDAAEAPLAPGPPPR